MVRLKKLEKEVRKLYEAKNPNRDEWADWLYKNHLFTVADNARNLAIRFGADPELSQAAAMLHDIADSEIARIDPKHEQTSEQTARRLLAEAGYGSKDIEIIVDDAIKFHGCLDRKIPKTLEGKVMATADAMAHLSKEFYSHAKKTGISVRKPGLSFKDWAKAKLHRDYKDKIQFEEIRKEAQPIYEKLLKEYV